MLAPWVGCAITLAVTGLAGCGGDDDGDDGGACELSAAVRGAIEWSDDTDPVCQDLFSAPTGIRMSFLPADQPILFFTVDVADVTAGATGTFDATVRLVHRDGRGWATPPTCTIQLDQHDRGGETEAGTSYQLAGQGTCDDPAAAEEGAVDPLQIDPFTFRFPASW